MAKTERTHAMRVLEAKGVPYRATVYDATGAFHSGEEAAELVGAPAERVYKTLVVMREGAPRARPLMVMVRVDAEIDLKLLAGSTGDKKLRMATQREAEQLTGMRVGGISALALRRPSFDVLLDEPARQLDQIQRERRHPRDRPRAGGHGPRRRDGRALRPGDGVGDPAPAAPPWPRFGDATAKPATRRTCSGMHLFGAPELPDCGADWLPPMTRSALEKGLGIRQY